MRALLRRLLNALAFGRRRTIPRDALVLAQRRELRRLKLGIYSELPPYNRPSANQVSPRSRRRDTTPPAG